MFEVSCSQASRKVEFFPWKRLNLFFLLVSALIRLVQWFVYGLYRVRFVLSFCLFVFPLMCKAEWGSNPVYWWLDLYFCFICLDEVSYTGYYWWLGDAGSCIQVVSFVWVVTIWYSVWIVLGEGNGTPLQCSCLENPRDGGAWWAAVYGVAQGWTRLKRLSSSSSSSSRDSSLVV